MRVIIIGLAALSIVLTALPAHSASLEVYAQQMIIARGQGTVVLTFPQGLRAVSTDGYRISAGSGRITLRSAGFAPLPEREPTDNEQDGKPLPDLPRASFSTANVRELMFRGRPTLSSADYTVSAGSLTSSDGGLKWSIADGVEFRSADGSKQVVRGQSFTFARKEGLLATDQPIHLAGFARENEATATISSGNTVINLKSRKITLTKAAEFGFAGYRLLSERMVIDLTEQVLSAEGSPRFVNADSEIAAAEVRLSFTEDGVTIDATDLQGYLALRL
ncbi:MAG: hypothetical protein A2Y63_01745 [Candidatus Riflebacteria bacterium RBG_13_59_9]|nr:MAG: hypothetical protein A2Y63_01745 [Candidatus Riflebacteria bacterium RBG_13_59_9]